MNRTNGVFDSVACSGVTDIILLKSSSTFALECIRKAALCNVTIQNDKLCQRVFGTSIAKCLVNNYVNRKYM